MLDTNQKLIVLELVQHTNSPRLSDDDREYAVMIKRRYEKQGDEIAISQKGWRRIKALGLKIHQQRRATRNIYGEVV